MRVQVRDGQSVQLHELHLDLTIFPDHQGLEHQRAGQIAAGLKDLHDLVKRDRSVLLKVEQPLAHTPQQFAKRRVSREIRPQCVKVDQKTEQGCQLVSVSVGEWNSEHDIIPARVTIKQSVERGGQHHEEADAFASTEAADSFRGIPPEGEDPFFTLVRERSRSRLLRRQVERIGLPR